MDEIAKRARHAANIMQKTTFEERNKILNSFITELKKSQNEIVISNEKDIKNAEEMKVEQSLIKRLILNHPKFSVSIEGIKQIINMPDPLGQCNYASEIATNGLFLYRVSCPIGVLAVIFEARPESAIQIASLCIKTGNALIMKGGKEAKETNKTVYIAIQNALLAVDDKFKFAVQLVENRDDIKELLEMHTYIDLVIPRGSKSLVEYIKMNTKIPVLGHSDGICNIFVDEHLQSFSNAIKTIVDSKMDYPAACNAVEILLIHQNIAEKFVPMLDDECAKYDIKFKADDVCYNYIKKCKKEHATEEDFSKEYLCNTVAIKCVKNIEEGIKHINEFGSHHTDSILSDNSFNIQLFMKSVDSAGVYANCSTRFADGFRYGFGAEVGISTNKIHARGPVGLDGLTIYKYRMYGKNHTVGAIKNGEEKFLHKKLDVSRDQINDTIIDQRHAQ